MDALHVSLFCENIRQVLQIFPNLSYPFSVSIKEEKPSSAKKSSFTGVASVVKGDKLAQMQTSDVSKSLEGTMAGVQILSNSGQPGDAATIMVRGIGSISASKEPLIVVDGVPYEGSLNSLSTQDIESLTVLKDAAANSMYGARGANGVVLVTTKRGQNGKVIVNLDARAGWNSRGVKTYDVMSDPGQYYETMWESVRNNFIESEGQEGANQYASQNLIGNYLKYNIFKGVADDQLIDSATGKLNPAATTRKWGDNWATDPFKSGLRQEYNLNLSGGTDKTSYFASVGYLGDEGFIDGSSFERISTRLKVDQEVTSFFKLGGNVAYSNTTQNTAMDSESLSSYNNVFMFSQQIAPIYPIYLYDVNDGTPIYDENGNQKYDFGSENQRAYSPEQNPVSTMMDNLNEFKTDNISLRGYLELKFLKDFKFTANMAYDVFNKTNTEFTTPNGGDAVTVNGRGYKYSSRYGAMNANQLLNYSKEFGLHSLNVLLGHETKKDSYNYLFGHMTNFVNSSNPEFSNATTYQDLTSYTQDYSLEGYFGRAEYNYNNRYYVSGSYRRDGSSRFAKDVRWGDFWAVGASWRISEEDFMKPLTQINSLKIKASYGTQGNDALLDPDGYKIWSAYRDIYKVDRVNGDAAMTLDFRGNDQLTWEKSKNFNAGFESRFFDRLNVNLDFFIKQTTDMLYASLIPASLGNPSYIWKNEMDMKNTGFEIELGVDVIKTNKVNWNISFNGTHYKNKLTRLPVSKVDPEGYQAGSYWRQLGGTLYDWYTYEYAGVDEKTGSPLYNKYTKDESGKEVCTQVGLSSEASLRKTGKSAIPDFYGGLASSLSLYGFDFSVQTAFQIGGYIMDANYQGLMTSGSSGQNFHKDILNRWTPTNTHTNVPALAYENQEYNASSDRWLTKASYFNLRNVTLGYTLPKKLTQQWQINNLRVYALADNVFLASTRKGLDPRQNTNGSVDFTYSALRTISFGVSLGF